MRWTQHVVEGPGVKTVFPPEGQAERGCSECPVGRYVSGTWRQAGFQGLDSKMPGGLLNGVTRE